MGGPGLRQVSANENPEHVDDDHDDRNDHDDRSMKVLIMLLKTIMMMILHRLLSPEVERMRMRHKSAGSAPAV